MCFITAVYNMLFILEKFEFFLDCDSSRSHCEIVSQKLFIKSRNQNSLPILHLIFCGVILSFSWGGGGGGVLVLL